MSIKKKSAIAGSAKETWALGPTELLVLTLIARGRATTLYALQQETSLSAGALVPALAKLRTKRLLYAESPGPRNRQEFSVEPEIMGQMETNWKSIAGRHIEDCDATIKLLKVAEQFNLSLAMEYVHEAVQRRFSAIRLYTNRDGDIEIPKLDLRKFSSYRAVARFNTLQAELQTLQAMEIALANRNFKVAKKSSYPDRRHQERDVP